MGVGERIQRRVFMTDFKAWLDFESIETAEDMLQVYRPVKDNEKGWKYSLSPVPTGPSGSYVLSGDLLLTSKSREAFIKYMDSLFESGVEGQYAYEHAMGKDD